MELCQKFIQKIGYSGLFSIEFLRDKDLSGCFKNREINIVKNIDKPLLIIKL